MQGTDGAHPLAGRYRLAVVTGAAMVGSIFLYGVIAAFAVPPVSGSAASVSPGILRPLFYGVAGVLVGPIVALKSAGLRRAVVRKPPEDPAARGARLFALETAGFALCEVPALLGLVLYILTGEIGDFYRLAGYALTLFLVFFPRYNAWREFER